MKVLIIGSGSSTHIIKWVNGLLEKNVSIILYSLNDFNKKSYAQHELLTTYSFGFSKNSMLGSKNLLSKVSYLRAIPEIKRIIKIHNPDILHAHYASSYGLIGSFLNFHPFIVSVWGSDVYDFPKKNILLRLLLKRVFRKADAVLSTSNIMAEETGKYTNKKILVTPFGVDITHFKPNLSKKTGSEIIVGTVKTLHPIYGIDVLIQAFSIVFKKNPTLNIKLEIAGTGPELTKLKKMVSEEKLDNSVTFLGYLDHSQIPNYLNRFDVFVALSRQESFGVAIVEAMACKIPVLVSDAEGLKEVVQDGTCGFVVPKDDAKTAAIMLEKLVLNENLRYKFGDLGRKRVLEMYNWDKNLEQMEAIYERVMANQLIT